MQAVKKALHFILLLASVLPVTGQQKNKLPERPALVVGIVVDQMREDYLLRYGHHFVKGGFRRFLKDGFAFRNCRYSYLPTYTAPGHASIFSGTTPAVHGIVGNSWLSESGNPVYCTRDDTAKGIGTDGKAGKMSPAQLKAGSVADQVRLSGNFRGKAFGVSFKDRGAILPAGHAANAAFWFDFSTGNFISSSWYRELKGALPLWLQQFNQQGPVKSCLDSVWKPLLPLQAYTASDADNRPWEKPLIAGRDPVFPYTLKVAGGPEKLAATPFGNLVLSRLAMELIGQEGLGNDSIMDFLSVSFSSPDIIGHAYGPNSIENEDCYLRLDRELEKFFAFLDRRVGEGKWLCFLTADHGAMEVPGFLNQHHIPVRHFSEEQTLDSLRTWSVKNTGKDWFAGLDNLQLYLKQEFFSLSQTEQENLKCQFISRLEKIPGINRAFALSGQKPWPEPPHLDKVGAGFYKGRSGHIQLITDPFYLNQLSPQGTTHGSPHPYDTHVPCLWLGWKVAAGEELRPVSIEDIAPTLSSLVRIPFPNASTGKAHSILLKTQQ